MMDNHADHIALGHVDWTNVCRCGHDFDDHLPMASRRPGARQGRANSACQLEHCHCMFFWRCPDDPTWADV